MCHGTSEPYMQWTIDLSSQMYYEYCRVLMVLLVLENMGRITEKVIQVLLEITNSHIKYYMESLLLNPKFLIGLPHTCARSKKQTMKDKYRIRVVFEENLAAQSPCLTY